jgi:hypothetical protein
VVSLAFRPIDSGIHCIAEESASLKMAPAALAAIEAIALLILGPGPFALGALQAGISVSRSKIGSKIGSTRI